MSTALFVDIQQPKTWQRSAGSPKCSKTKPSTSYIILLISLTWPMASIWCPGVTTQPKASKEAYMCTLYTFRLNSILPPQDATPTSSLHVQKSIAQALRAFVNLSDLSLRIGLPEGEGTPLLLRWTFEGCRFLLTAFSGNFPGLTLDDIWNVISEHLNIHYWVPSDPFLKSLSFIPSNVLPCVVDVVFVHPDATIYLQLFRRSLTHLYYTYYGQQDHNWTSADIVSCLAMHAPNLTSLSICCFEHVKLTVSSASLRISWIHTYYVILGWCYHCETAYRSYFWLATSRSAPDWRWCDPYPSFRWRKSSGTKFYTWHTYVVGIFTRRLLQCCNVAHEVVPCTASDILATQRWQWESQQCVLFCNIRGLSGEDGRI